MIVLLLLVLFSTVLTANTVYVSAHGAIPNDGIDDTPAIQNAIASCSKQGATLIFDAGTYNISGPTPNSQGGGGNIFLLVAYNNINIQGNNTRLVGTNWATVFRFTRCNNIKVEGFQIDWKLAHLPFTPGKVTSINGNYFDLDLYAPHIFKPGLRAEVYADYDPAKMRYLEGGNRYRETVLTPACTNPAPGVMRCYSNRINLITVGSDAIVQHAKHAGNGFVLAACTQVLLKDITIYSVPGLAVALSSSTDVALEDFHVKLKPNVANWWLSAAAGATNYSSPRGTIRFTNVTLQGMGDDGANLHSRLMRITEVVNTNTLKVVDHWLGSFMPTLMIPLQGDVLEFGRNSTPFNYFTNQTVTSAYNDPAGFTVVELNSTSGLVAGDIISNVSALPTQAIFENCTVGKNRGRAFLISCDNVTIKNCILEDLSGPAILAHAEADFFMDAKPPRNLVIQNNTIRNCNFGSPLGEAMIELAVRNGGSVLGSAGLINNVTIEGNSFESEHGANGIFVGSTNNIRLINNSFDNIIEDRVIYENTGCQVFTNEWHSTNSSPYGGTPPTIPGRIEAEDYDLGGETVAYHDLSANASTVYRSDQVTLRQFGSAILISSMACKEWTKYSVSVPQAGMYDLAVQLIPYSANSKFRLITNEADTLGDILIPTTNGIGNPVSVTIPDVFLDNAVTSFRFFVVSGGFNFDYIDVMLSETCIALDLSVALEGPYNLSTGGMSNQLNTFGLLPGQTPPIGNPTPIGQPFAGAPWNYNGAEGQYFGTAPYPEDAVDWVLVGFRSTTNKSDEISRLAGLLHQNGSISFPSGCPFPLGSLTDAYIVVEHRNHMAAMSPTTIPVTNEVLSFDFRLQDSWKTSASVGQKEIVSGVWTMIAGDCDQVTDLQGYDINGADKIIFNTENGAFYEYLRADFNLDASTDGADKIYWDRNNGLFSGITK